MKMIIIFHFHIVYGNNVDQVEFSEKDIAQCLMKIGEKPKKVSSKKIFNRHLKEVYKYLSHIFLE